MDVLTCVDEVCDTSKAPKDRLWQYGDLAAGTPEAHRNAQSSSMVTTNNKKHGLAQVRKDTQTSIQTVRSLPLHSVLLLNREAQC